MRRIFGVQMYQLKQRIHFSIIGNR